jgi:hypothetical protein
MLMTAMPTGKVPEGLAHVAVAPPEPDELPPEGVEPDWLPLLPPAEPFASVAPVAAVGLLGLAEAVGPVGLLAAPLAVIGLPPAVDVAAADWPPPGDAPPGAIELEELPELVVPLVPNPPDATRWAWLPEGTAIQTTRANTTRARRPVPPRSCTPARRHQSRN